ncbi:MAG: phospho-sugar mutase [Actinomycetaceae bacterium]|nr:phospho-sugar mutase [Actinomycetaceae bacterium]
MAYNPDEVRAWIAHDPDPQTAAELAALLEAAEAGDEHAQAELNSAFSGPLTFGTAGLRGRMGAGVTRMNRAVVRRAAAGLVAYLKEKVGDDALLVVGYDARYHSADFAADTAAIAAAAGIRAQIMPRALPTPLLAYAVRKLDADAGVMVTASHNPAADNGYKVYLGGCLADEAGKGVQLVSPADSEIAALIAAAPPADEIPLAEGYETIDEALIEAYIDETAALIPDGFTSDLPIVYTAMHGVGAQTMRKLFTKAGFTNVTEVAEQCEPDPDFPTVPFPNPEEDGALDMAIEKARASGAQLVIASDPDADRCSIAIPDGKDWRQLSGDEIGSILGKYLAEHIPPTTENPTFASSIVSSRLLSKIAEAHELGYAGTLTGFKWIARTENLVYGYEEAIGFCVNPEAVRDKDGMSAALLLAHIAHLQNARGEGLQDVLDRLYVEHGVYLSAPVTLRVNDLAIIPATMARVRATPPAELAQSAIVSSIDLNDGSQALGLPPSDVVMWYTEQNDRVVVRPSGTEPKVKCYLEVYVPVERPEDLAEAKRAAARRMDVLKKDVAAALGM